MTPDCDICRAPLTHGGYLCATHLTARATIELRIQATRNAGRDPEPADLRAFVDFEERRLVGCTARLKTASGVYDAASTALGEVRNAIYDEERERYEWRRGSVDQLHLALCRAVLHERELAMQDARAVHADAYRSWDATRRAAEAARVEALTPHEAEAERWQAQQRAHGYDGLPGSRTGD